MSKSLYAVLNVAPDADPAVVEAAYKALMKKYHPDVRTDDPETARRRAAEINEAFHVLKDPAKREQYDANERGRIEAMRRNAVTMAEAQRPYQPPPGPRRKHSKWPTLFIIAAAAAAVFLIWRGSDAALGERIGLDGFSSVAQPRRSQPKLAAVSVDDIDRAVAEFKRIRDRSGLLGLSAYSRDCFAAQNRWEQASEFDFCVAFDHAAVTYGAGLSGHDYLPKLPRFEPREVRVRHASAGRLLSNDESVIGARVANVGSLLSSRLASPDAPSVAAADLPPRLAGTQPRAATQPLAKRAPTRRSNRVRQRQPRNRTPPSDPDFLEREGYIY